MPTRCILYARVSTDEQSEGPSLTEQLRACKEYAILHSMAVVHEYHEDFTGMTLERPMLTLALKQLSQGVANALVVLHHDRLSRNYIDFLILRDQLDKAGIELHFVNTGKDQSGFEGLLVSSMHALLAHGERERYLARTRMGKVGKARQGKVTTQPPYGYFRDQDGKIQIDDDKIGLIRQIFFWAAYGDHENGPFTLYKICKRINDLMIPPPYSERRNVRQWNPGTIWRILKNEFYIGTAYFGKTITQNGKRKKQPKSNWIAIPVPATIDKKTFDLVQRRLKKNQRQAKRNKKHSYLLSGHARCGTCGWAMTGQTIRKRYVYYICGYHGHKGTMHRECSKVSRYIPAEPLDKLVVSWLIDLISNDRRLIDGLEQMQNNARDSVQNKQERIDQIKQLIKTEEVRVTRLVTRLGDIDDDTVAAVLVDQVKGSKKRKEMLNFESERLEEEIHQFLISPDTKKHVLIFARQVREKLHDMTLEDVQQLLDILDVYVVVFQDKRGKGQHEVKISCAIPDVDVGIDLGSFASPPTDAKQPKHAYERVVFSTSLAMVV